MAEQDLSAQIIAEIEKLTETVNGIAEALRALESHLDLIASAPPWYAAAGKGGQQ